MVSCSNLCGDIAQSSKMHYKPRGGGAPHIPFEGIWSNIQTKVGTPHQIGAARLRSRVGGRLSNVILDPTLALIRAQLGFRIQVRAECGN